MANEDSITFCAGDTEYTVPGKYVVCSGCEGRGKHVNRAIDGNGLSREDFDEQGPEFMEDYFSGVYDVVCDTCGGKRVEMVPDRARMSPAERATWREHLNEERDYRAICEGELRMGA